MAFLTRRARLLTYIYNVLSHILASALGSGTRTKLNNIWGWNTYLGHLLGLMSVSKVLFFNLKKKEEKKEGEVIKSIIQPFSLKLNFSAADRLILLPQREVFLYYV